MATSTPLDLDACLTSKFSLQYNTLVPPPFYLGIRRYNVDEAEERKQRQTDDPHAEFLPQRQRLHETHLRPEPDARQVLLAVRVRDELSSPEDRTIMFKKYQ